MCERHRALVACGAHVVWTVWTGSCIPVCRMLHEWGRRNKLEPVVTLHHFVHPLWFDALGGFTTDAGIPHFVSFATFAVRCDAPSHTMVLHLTKLNCET